jgi:hypothetical protein
MSRYTGTRKSNMTTIINFNILNVYNLKQNTFRVNNIRSRDGDDNQSKYSRSAEERIIDITPEFRALNERVNSMPYTKGFPDYRGETIVNKMKDGIYDRNCRSVQYCQAKGMHIDSYA